MNFASFCFVLLGNHYRKVENQRKKLSENRENIKQGEYNKEKSENKIELENQSLNMYINENCPRQK